MTYYIPPKYTTNGFRIDDLLQEATNYYQSKKNISVEEALDAIAKKYGYSDWNEIMEGGFYPIRDDFFDRYFQEKNARKEIDDLYQDYLKERNKKDSPETHRNYVLLEYEKFKRLGLNKLIYTHIDITPDELLQKIDSHFEKFGIKGFLPQNLSNDILEGLIINYKRAFDIAKNIDTEDSQEDKKIGCHAHPLLKCTLYLLLHRGTEITLDEEELYSFTESYLIHLNNEWVSRLSEIQFSKPTLDDIFDQTKPISIKII